MRLLFSQVLDADWFGVRAAVWREPDRSGIVGRDVPNSDASACNFAIPKCESSRGATAYHLPKRFALLDPVPIRACVTVRFSGERFWSPGLLCLPFHTLTAIAMFQSVRDNRPGFSGSPRGNLRVFARRSCSVHFRDPARLPDRQLTRATQHWEPARLPAEPFSMQALRLINIPSLTSSRGVSCCNIAGCHRRTIQ